VASWALPREWRRARPAACQGTHNDPRAHVLRSWFVVGAGSGACRGALVAGWQTPPAGVGRWAGERGDAHTVSHRAAGRTGETVAKWAGVAVQKAKWQVWWNLGLFLSTNTPWHKLNKSPRFYLATGDWMRGILPYSFLCSETESAIQWGKMHENVLRLQESSVLLKILQKFQTWLLSGPAA